MSKENAHLDLAYLKKLESLMDREDVSVIAHYTETKKAGLAINRDQLGLCLSALRELMQYATYTQENANSQWADDIITKYLGPENSRKKKSEKKIFEEGNLVIPKK